MRFGELPLRTDVYAQEPGIMNRFGALDRALLEGNHSQARVAIRELQIQLQAWTRSQVRSFSDMEREAAARSLLEVKATLCCLAQRAFVTFWSQRHDARPSGSFEGFLDLYKAHLQRFYDTFIDLPPSQKEEGNRRYNRILLGIGESDSLLRRIGGLVVNDVARLLVEELPRELSEYLWNEATTSYYSGQSKFGVNLFVENYDGYLRDLLFYFDASKDFVADAVVERIRRTPSDRAFHMLEPGAGTGDLLFRIVKRLRPSEQGRFFYRGFDLSPEMRDRFESRRAGALASDALSRARLEIANAVDRASWPRTIEEGTFDLVALTFMLHHVYPPKRPVSRERGQDAPPRRLVPLPRRHGGAFLVQALSRSTGRRVARVFRALPPHFRRRMGLGISPGRTEILPGARGE